jgi:hypothetical protein
LLGLLAGGDVVEGAGAAHHVVVGVAQGADGGFDPARAVGVGAQAELELGDVLVALADAAQALVDRMRSSSETKSRRLWPMVRRASKPVVCARPG